MEKLSMNSNVVFGAGSIDALSAFNGRHVAIVTDPVISKNGIADSAAGLMGCGRSAIFDNIAPDPTLEQVAECCRFIESIKADVVVAIGGGSAIDTVKAAVLVLCGKGEKIYFAAVPTTAGTGSEVTNYTVVKDVAAGRKIPISDDRIVPDMAILDYTLTKTVPKAVTAFTGMDVITHALEAYVANGKNAVTDAYAEKALRLAFGNLHEAYLHGDEDAPRENMMMASYLAGLAFTKAGLGICHSIAHALGAAFKMPHGEANAIVLPHVIAFNGGLDVPFGADKSPSALRYAEVARIIGLPSAGTRLSVQYLVREIENLNNKLSIPKTLMQLGVNAADMKERRAGIIQSVLNDGCTPANPVEPDAGQIGRILDRVLG
ncbi:MAG: iron-containing alcohol dehydrogenase [Clostridia bacterium]|nr:iron-containing alcohol dehydrogenase [Clostridia bacterium]